MAPTPLVLVVEDDVHVRHAISVFLAVLGCEVVTVEDGAEAVGYLASRPPPALIVLDVMMPRMDGVGFRKYQLGRPELANIPVVVLTARVDIDREAALFRGVTWLAKPFQARELRDAVKAALQI